MSQFITTTPLLDMRPIGVAAERSLPRLEAILAREFQGRISMRLAEPVERRDGTGIDWYIENENDDPLVRLKDLPDEIAAHYKKRLNADIAIISSAIKTYEQRSDPTGHSSATALKSAICYPSDENLWVMGDARSGRGAVVITAWGYEPRTSDLTAGKTIHRRERVYPDSRQVVIDREPSETEQTLPQTETKTVVGGTNWLRILSSLLWVIAILLPFVIGWWLLPACGLRIPFTQSYIYGWGDGAFCRQLPNPQMEAGRQQETALNADLASAQEAVRTKIAQCVVTPRAEAETPASADEERIQAEGLATDPNETSVSLTWNNTNDLDLFIRCPDGGLVPLEGSRCGFTHKIDTNRGGSLVSDAVEYIRNESGALQSGTYQVLVKYYKYNPPSPVATDFTVTLRRDGVKTEKHKTTSDRIPPEGDNKEFIAVTEFTVP